MRNYHGVGSQHTFNLLPVILHLTSNLIQKIVGIVSRHASQVQSTLYVTHVRSQIAWNGWSAGCMPTATAHGHAFSSRDAQSEGGCAEERTTQSRRACNPFPNLPILLHNINSNALNTSEMSSTTYHKRCTRILVSLATLLFIFIGTVLGAAELGRTYFSNIHFHFFITRV